MIEGLNGPVKRLFAKPFGSPEKGCGANKIGLFTILSKIVFSQRKHAVWLAAGIILLGSFGCRGPSTPVHFYALASMAGNPLQQTNAGIPKDLLVGVGPIELPEIYNRPQIVTTAGQNRLTLSEYHRWAGVLQEEISIVLAENLSVLLQSERVVSFPWDGISDPDIRIFVRVHRFEGTLGQKAVFAATWSMRGPRSDDRPPVVKKTFLEAPVDDAAYSAYIAAQNRLLAAFSREMASEIVKMHPR